MAGLVGLLGNITGSQDLKDWSANFNSPQENMQTLQQQQLLQEMQAKQATQTLLQQFMQLPPEQRDPKVLYGGLATLTGDPTALAKFAETQGSKPKYTQMGGKLVMTDENNPSASPKVVYSQPTADERKQTESEKKALKQEEDRKRNAISSLQSISDIESRLSDAGGIRRSIFGHTVPGSQSYNIDSDLQTVRSNIGLDILSAMKQDSSTGASGLGALNAKELDLLISKWGNLGIGQGDAQLKKNLEKVKERFAEVAGVGPATVAQEKKSAPKLDHLTDAQLEAIANGR